MKQHNEQGFGMIEGLVAIMLFGLAAAMTAPIIISSLHATESSRDQASVVAEVEQLMNTYRTQSLLTTLANINATISSISNDDTTTINSTATNANATFATTLTAIKTQTNGIPEAVRVRIAVTQNQGIFGSRTYAFETIVTSLG